MQFAYSPIDVQRKLTELETYCNPLDLRINPAKTNIMHFHKGRPRKQKLKFTCQDKEINYTNRYSYLGLLYTTSGIFIENAKEMVNKSKKATVGIKDTLLKSKLFDWDVINKLFESIVSPTLLYASETWAFNHVEIIEKGQTHYFKNILGWTKTITNYIVRQETSQNKLELLIIKSILLKSY